MNFFSLVAGKVIAESSGAGSSGADTRLKELVEGTMTELVDDTITEIGKRAFYYNQYLAKVELPNCTKIGEYAFTNSNVETVVLPKVETMGTSPFLYCEKLTDVDLPNCENITSTAFKGIDTLENINILGCKTLGKEAISGCTSLKNINLPNCTTIGESAFSGCKALESVDLGSATTISKSAFNSCAKLTTLIIRTNQVASAVSTTLTYSAIASGTGYIYVPDDLVEDYKVTNIWSSYADQIKGLSELDGVI